MLGAYEIEHRAPSRAHRAQSTEHRAQSTEPKVQQPAQIGQRPEYTGQTAPQKPPSPKQSTSRQPRTQDREEHAHDPVRLQLQLQYCSVGWQSQASAPKRYGCKSTEGRSTQNKVRIRAHHRPPNKWLSPKRWGLCQRPPPSVPLLARLRVCRW